MSTPSISDMQTAERIVLVTIPPPLIHAGMVDGPRLRDAIAAALCEQRDAEFQTLRKIVAIHDKLNTPLDIAIGCDAMAMLARDRLAELTGGGTEEQR